MEEMSSKIMVLHGNIINTNIVLVLHNVPVYLEEIKDALDMLRRAKSYISKVDPGLVKNQPPIGEQIAVTQEHIRQHDEGRKKARPKKQEQAR